MKNYCFTVDDNIRFLREITERAYRSLFDHPYLNVYKRLHERYGVKIQLNLFYETEGFDLSRVTDRYRDEWRACSDWLMLSFHSRIENVKPYEGASYDEVAYDCGRVHREIVRFASSESLAKTTTVHYCLATEDGIRALKDNQVKGLLGLYGTAKQPRNSYQSSSDEGDLIRSGGVSWRDGIGYAGIDIVMNCFSKEEIFERLNELKKRDFVKVMIHEQYFYADYAAYQPDFEEKLNATFACLAETGFCSIFFEERLNLN